jgi:hypothetical protein
MILSCFCQFVSGFLKLLKERSQKMDIVKVTRAFSEYSSPTISSSATAKKNSLLNWAAML